MIRPPIMAGLATVPERHSSLEQTLRSISPQVDRVFVSLNDYTEWPTIVDELDNVRAVVRGPGNGGDAEKFAEVDDWPGIVVTIDDDLLYPPDYVQRLVDGLDRHGPDALVGFHGGKTLGWNGKPVAATHKRIACLGDLAEDDTDVNVLGTGALAFHADYVPVWRDLFRHPNMADVHLACHARTFGLRMVALAHRAGWLQNILPAGQTGIYEANQAGDGTARDTREQRRAELDRHDWTQQPTRPRVRVSIATCERPELLDDLLSDLEIAARRLDVHVAVYDDASTSDYRAARARAERNGWTWHRFEERLGKQAHSVLVTRELEDCRTSDAEWFVFLPDDVRLVRHALARAIDTWLRLDDPATLTLWRLKDHEGQPNWTGLLPVDRDDAFEVFHVDGIYLCQRDTLEALDYRCPPLARNWRAGRRSSSGVGRAMSTHLHASGRRMYRVSRSLAVPVPDVPSVMNPDVRDRRYPGVAL